MKPVGRKDVWLYESGLTHKFLFLSVCAHACGHPWRPGNGVRFPVADVTGDCDPPDNGTGDQILILLMNTKNS